MNKSKMTQDEIKFDNMQGNRVGGWHRNSPYKSLGNVLNWLYVFGTFDIMESCTVGDNKINYHGKEILEIVGWDDNMAMPLFKSNFTQYDYIVEKQIIFIEVSRKKKFIVFEHLCLPDRGFRFYTMNSGTNAKSINDELWYTPIFYTDSTEEAQSYASQPNQSQIPSFRELEKYFKEKLDAEERTSI